MIKVIKWFVAVPVIIGILFLANGCQTESETPVHTSKPVTYVAGYTNYFFDQASSRFYCAPCYWRDGARIDLSAPADHTFSAANAICVVGNDVYVAGYTGYHQGGFAFSTIPCYWKNGVRTDFAGYGYAYSIFVSAGDVYVAGNTYAHEISSSVFAKNMPAPGIIFPDPWPCYWKNGVRTDLDCQTDSTRGGNANSIYVSGSDVYVAGSILNFSTPNELACYWKNGVRAILSVIDDRYDWGHANSIYISGSDVYVAGTNSHYGLGEIPGSLLAGYWKNGALTNLSGTDPLSFCDGLSLCVSGSDVYVAGSTDNPNVPCYWKNGARTNLGVPGGSTAGRAYSIFVLDSDVYIAGTNDNELGINACYWKNGIRTDLVNETHGTRNGANAIVVVNQ